MRSYSEVAPGETLIEDEGMTYVMVAHRLRPRHWSVHLAEVFLSDADYYEYGLEIWRSTFWSSADDDAYELFDWLVRYALEMPSILKPDSLYLVAGGYVYDARPPCEYNYNVTVN